MYGTHPAAIDRLESQEVSHERQICATPGSHRGEWIDDELDRACDELDRAAMVARTNIPHMGK